MNAPWLAVLSVPLVLQLTAGVQTGQAQEAKRRWDRLCQIRQEKFDRILPEVLRENGVDLWIVAMGIMVLAVLTAAMCLATTVLALRTPGLRLSRVPFFAWSVLVASVLWK